MQSHSTRTLLIRAMTLAIFGCSCLFAVGEEIPERTIHFSSRTPGIGIHSVDMRKNYLTTQVESEGDFQREIVLPKNQPIVMIIGGSREYAPEDVKKICDQSPYVVQELRIIGSFDTDRVDRALNAMATQKTLKVISFSRCDVTSFTPLVNIPSLEGLVLTDCELPFNLDFAQALAKTNIKWLCFHGTGKENIFRDVSHIKSLEVVSFWKVAAASDQISDIGLLNKLPHLQGLGLKDVDITSDSLRYISQLSSIRTLDLSYNRNLGDADFEVLGNMKGLQEVEVEDMPLSTESFATLQALKSIKITGEPELFDPE